MAAVVGNFYDALRSAGVPDDKALKASEELFEQTSAIDSLRAGLKAVEGRLDKVERKLEEIIKDVTDLKSGFAVMRWMLGFNVAMTVAIVGKLFLAH